jgi:5-methylcytosine-specific restriction endonuclease McrA
MNQQGQRGGVVSQRADRAPAHRTRRAHHPTNSGRYASDALKMGCPFCGASESAVVNSRGLITGDKIRRRRECASCGEVFPTAERLDRVALVHELERFGDRPALLDITAGPRSPAWVELEASLHRLWGQAKDRIYSKPDWIKLQEQLARLERLA